MERRVQTHDFGSHRVEVVERVDDDGTTSIVLVDGAVVTDPPLQAVPRRPTTWAGPSGGAPPP